MLRRALPFSVRCSARSGPRAVSLVGTFTFISARRFNSSSSPQAAAAAAAAAMKASINDAESDGASASSTSTRQQLKNDMSGARVFFASASSAEVVPHVAVAEAFDTAHAALQSVNAPPPNFAFAVVSVDHEGMLDAPQHLHRSFSQIEQEYEQHPFFQGANSTTNRNNRLLLGSLVRSQRVGSTGFVEIILGHIPDLRVSTFTFDQVPEKLYGDGASSASSSISNNNSKLPRQPVDSPVALGFALSDWRIGALHSLQLNERLAATSDLIALHNEMVAKKRGVGPIFKAGEAPLVGGVLQPAECAATAECRDKKIMEAAQAEIANAGNDDDERKQAVLAEAESQKMQQTPPSVYFINGQIYRGAAGAVLLHSDLLQAHVMSIMPSVPVASPVKSLRAAQNDSYTVDINDSFVDENTGHWHIHKMGGKTACNFIREVYESDAGLKQRIKSKLFLGLMPVSSSTATTTTADASPAQPYPLIFVGCPNEGGHLVVPLPKFLLDTARNATAVTLLRDDDEAEEQAIASDLMRMERSPYLLPRQDGGTFCSARERITIHREKRVDVPLANACCLHWSHPMMYKVAIQPESHEAGLLSIGGRTIDKHAPTIAARILGKAVPNSGMYCSGTLLPELAACPEQKTPLVQARSSVHVILREKTLQE